MLKKSIIAFLSVMFLCWLLSLYFSETQTFEITDVTKPQTITLRKLETQKFIHAICIKCSGYIEGEAEISRILNWKADWTEILSDKVNFERGHDCYSDSVTLEYKPNSVKKGKLTLKYRFLD